MSLPLFRNSSSHDTVSSVPVFTGNAVSVLRLFQAGSRPVHSGTSDGTRDTCVMFARPRVRFGTRKILIKPTKCLSVS